MNKPLQLLFAKQLIRLNDYFDFHLSLDVTRNLMKSQENSVEYKF